MATKGTASTALASNAAGFRYVSLTQAGHRTDGRLPDPVTVRKFCERHLPAALSRLPGRRDKVDIRLLLEFLAGRNVDQLQQAEAV